MHKILLFGATSILGFNLAKLFSDTVIPFTSPGNKMPIVQQWSVLNLEDPSWIKEIFDQYHPKLLLYCHAVCDVPKCEANPEWAYEINVRHLQRVLRAIPEQTRLIYVSSDHVFGEDGTYDEDSAPCPISVYGRTRVEVERLALEKP
jgi:dTDP-4-dehydrorhamnose reductase